MKLSLPFIAVIAALCAPGISFAQKKQFTMAEAVNGMATTLAPKGIKNASWQPGTNTLWRADKKNEMDVWLATTYSADNAAQAKYIEPGKYPESEKVSGIPAIKWLSREQAWFQNGKNIILGTINGDVWKWTVLAYLPEEAENVTVDKSLKIAYTVGNNLWMWDQENGKVRVSNEPNKDIVCGKAVHRDEFGIDRGIFFSPKGNYIAYYRMDQTMVKDYPVVKWDVTPARADLVKYPMAGGPSHEVTLCVYETASGKTVTMKTGEKHKDHYLTSVTWGPSEKTIYIGILSREQNNLLLNKYSATTGEKMATLFQETDKKYVHPTHPLFFIPGTPDEFVWWSERDGYQHLYRYNTDGKLINQITKGNWVVNEITGFNRHDNTIVFTASKESPLEKHIYTVGVNGGRIDRIDKGAGMHTATASDNGEFVLDVYNGPGVPKNIYVRATGNPSSLEITKAENTLINYDRPEIRNVNIKAADGVTNLYGKLILPTNFDSSRKYPVIVYLYNGPNVQLLHNSFPESGNLWYEYMAQHGYIVFTMDGRGSWNRGLEFEQATFRKLGDVEMDDQLKGVEYLKKLSYVDEKRMGVHGWSFGGFMTTSLMLRHPGVFKCGVAGGPVIDWSMYEVMYTERYMNTPQTNPDGYKRANLLFKVKGLQGKLMLIHGTSDDVVVWQHSIDLIKKSVDEGVQIDYFVYPGHEHNVRGKDRVHLMQKVTNYFDEYLK